jgi:outer membrane receptor protein involved in Fe transport
MEGKSAGAIEEVVVIGSQIKGAKITGALPVTVVETEDIEAAAAVSADDLFRSIPQAGDITFNGTYLSGGNSNAARGDVSTVSLRGLAQGNTLVLLNGRRSVVHPTSQTDNSTPVFGYNVNAIPVAGLARVEVLKDGAAPLYGSDAVAGVVNNVLQSDFVGLELGIQYGVAEGSESAASILYGTDFNDGKGNISLFLGTTQKDEIRARDQAYTSSSDQRPLVEGTSFEGNVAFDNRSTSSPWGGFQALGVTSPVTSNGEPITDSAGNFHVQPTSNAGCTYAISDSICYDDGSVTGSEDRNLRLDTRKGEFWVLPSVERYNVFSFINYDVSDALSFFGELGYYHAETEAVNTAPGSLASTPIVLPASSYWNPFGPIDSPNRLPGLDIPDEGLDIQIRNYNYFDAGPRRIDVENDQYRILGGLRGDAFGWSWESAVLYNEANVKDSSDGGSSTLVQQALARTTPDAYNPFNGGDPANPSVGDATPNPASVAESFRITAVRENNTSLALWDFKVSRPDIFALPAGEVGVAAGVEFRREEYEDNRDRRQDTSSPYVDMVTGTVYGSDLMSHSPSPDVAGDRNVTSAHIEFGVPIVSPAMNIPLVQAVDLQVAARYEDYDDVGSVTKPKVAGSWDVFDGFRLRSSWSEGFKAPNLEVLNTPLLERLNTRTDYVKCEADLRAGRIDDFSRCTRAYGVPGLRQGNANLEPEESESFSYGLVFEPLFLPERYGSFIFTVDRWKIEQTGIIGVLDEQSAMNLDYLYRLHGSSNPLVVRAEPTPAEIEDFQGAGLTAAGEVLYVDAAFSNLLPLEVAGIDFGLVYDNGFDQYGDLRVNVNATKLTKFYQSPSQEQQILLNASQAGELNPGVPVTGAADLIGQGGNPEWKWTLSVTWIKHPWQIGFFTQYTDEVQQSDILDAGLNAWEVDSQQTYNLYGQYTIEGWLGGDTTVRVGARNLTDEDPPFADGGYLGNLYQPIARYWYASVKTAF